jgi:hypothetical protein
VVRRTVVLLAVLPALLVVATSCGSRSEHDSEADRLTPPPGDACHDLAAGDLERPTDPRPAVPCSSRHTTQTFAVGTLPSGTGKAYDDRRLGAFVFATCSQAFRDYLGVDDSLAMRIQLRWAWFRPSKHAWDRGARWYRCDVVANDVEHDGDREGDREGDTTLPALPVDVHGLFSTDLPDAWLTCARGTSVTSATRVPCSDRHDWRAVSTIKVGLPADPYPGDRVVQVRSRDRCSDWVGAWSHYAPDYDFGYTWFHEAEWSTGNRRSICWARTDR